MEPIACTSNFLRILPNFLNSGIWHTSVRFLSISPKSFVGQPGKDKNSTVPSVHKELFLVNPDPKSNTLTLIAETANFSHDNGGVLSPPILDVRERNNRSFYEKLVWEGMLIVVLISFGIYHFILHIIRPNYTALWFGIFCLLLSIRTMFVSERLAVWLFQTDYIVQLSIRRKLEELTNFIECRKVLEYSIIF